MTEKPCGETYSDIKRCYDLAERMDKVLLTGFQRRFDTTFQDVFQASRNKALGDLRFLRVTGRDSPKPSYEFLRNTDVSGCSLISDMAVHDIDMTVWLTSAERPISVYTMSHMHDPIMKEIGQPDSGLLALKYESGLIAIIDSDRESPYGYDMRIEMFGSEGMVNAENRRESSAVIDGQDGGKLKRLLNSFPQRFEAAFENEIDHFIDCLDGKDTPLIKKEECLLTMEIVEKGVESFKTGKVEYL
ncbi:myo-inositol 2-dehydrogenase-like [Pecten maximus]|uniref:myo-inositol 2-dehydrogenase-like n=1 Tax=Pecten maximus TaxID=6579 RepID=UPI00145833BF|nr:myo-inositol 2-dehydrogenase-like [Pecten maximus]